jgi:RNA polymerase sigma-54 factor
MIKHGLNIGLGQSLTMTPQLQQAIRLLQLSTMELESEIQTTLDSNPLLQITEENNDSDVNAVENTAIGTVNTDDTLKDKPDDNIPNEMDIDAKWEEIYNDYSPSNNTDSTLDSTTSILEKTHSASDSLQSHLYWQIELSNLSVIDKAIATAIIDGINERGYLSTSVHSLYRSLKQDLLLESVDEIESILSYIQRLDPIGVGARTPGECLAIQLKIQYPNNSLALKSAKLLKQQPELLELKRHAIFKKYLKLSETRFTQLIKLLKTLNPYPGAEFNSENIGYITPDVYAKKIKGQWHVSLNAKVMPNLQINDFYADLLLNKGTSSEIKYLKSNLQQANWFIKSIQSRNQTILKVTQLIVQHQKAFLQYGAQAMKPMVLRDIAEPLNMHESSISRATTRKYLHTPQGIFELKYFFSSQVATTLGGNCSATAIQSMIKTLIAQENLKKPLSDNMLTVQLRKQGIKVARRTVAKYREALNIPASHERKMLV